MSVVEGSMCEKMDFILEFATEIREALEVSLALNQIGTRTQKFNRFLVVFCILAKL